MELAKYKAEIDKINEESRIKKRHLKKDYALSHSDAKIGNVVTDHIGSIRIETIKIYNAEIPSCVYYGTCLTKTGKFFKSGKKRGLWQINIK